MDKIHIYLEIGKKRVFACALDWPGWSRISHDEASAITTLLESAPRYASILHASQIDFDPPTDIAAFQITDRLAGNSTTDFGAPDAVPPADAAAMSDTDLGRAKALLTAYWHAFDMAVKQARGKELRKGPRGGGRELEAIVQHVIDVDTSYLRQLGWKLKRNGEAPQGEQLARLRDATFAALDSAHAGNLPERGPRGGKRWSPRYFVRRSGWHTLDHVWEIEDRVVQDNA